MFTVNIWHHHFCGRRLTAEMFVFVRSSVGVCVTQPADKTLRGERSRLFSGSCSWKCCSTPTSVKLQHSNFLGWSQTRCLRASDSVILIHVRLCVCRWFSGTLCVHTRFALSPASQCKSCWVTACERGIQAQFIFISTSSDQIHLKKWALEGWLVVRSVFVLPQ